MILPTKHLSTSDSLLNVAAVVLRRLQGRTTVTALWTSVRDAGEVTSFERFVLALDLLYALGAVEFEDGMLGRCRP